MFESPFHGSLYTEELFPSRSFEHGWAPTYGTTKRSLRTRRLSESRSWSGRVCERECRSDI